jgi:hypothetical protein
VDGYPPVRQDVCPLAWRSHSTGWLREKEPNKANNTYEGFCTYVLLPESTKTLASITISVALVIKKSKKIKKTLFRLYELDIIVKDKGGKARMGIGMLS